MEKVRVEHPSSSLEIAEGGLSSCLNLHHLAQWNENKIWLRRSRKLGLWVKKEVVSFWKLHEMNGLRKRYKKILKKSVDIIIALK